MGYTQEPLADLLNISRDHYGRLEIGIKTPSIDLLVELSEILFVFMDSLFTGKNPNNETIKLRLRAAAEILSSVEKSL